MVKLKVKVGAKGQVVIPKVIRDKLGIKPDDVLLVDEEGGRIVIEKQNMDDFIEWVKKTRKKVAGEVYRIALEDELQTRFTGLDWRMSSNENFSGCQLSDLPEVL